MRLKLNCVFYVTDRIKNPRSVISRAKGYPDPTFGIIKDEKSADELTLETMRKNFDNQLLEDIEYK